MPQCKNLLQKFREIIDLFLDYGGEPQRDILRIFNADKYRLLKRFCRNIRISWRFEKGKTSSVLCRQNILINVIK